VVIKRSSAGEIEVLLADLDADDDVRREAASARLAVIGARAVSGLVDLLHRTPSSRTRVAVLQALESVRDPRALDAAVTCLDIPDAAVAVQAVNVVRRYLASGDGPRAIDRLAAIAVDAAEGQGKRLAAVEALSDMPDRTVQPIWRRLRNDSDPLVAHRARLALGIEQPDPSPSEVLEAAAAGSLPEDPRLLKAAIASAGGEAPLPTLHRVVEVLRRCEHEAGERSRVADWRGARAALHQELAGRGSSVALYDLRETLEQATAPLPVEFLTALAAIGNRTCLDAIAEAYVQAPHGSGAQDWWRAHLAGAFREIVRREGLTERHGALKHVRSKWPEAARALLGPPRAGRRH
jgi:HEAT repeat protein